MNDFFIGFKGGFKRFGDRIADIVNFVLLLFAYFVGIAMVAIVSKIVGKHYLDLKTSKKKSYWVKHPPVSKNIDDYYRQF